MTAAMGGFVGITFRQVLVAPDLRLVRQLREFFSLFCEYMGLVMWYYSNVARSRVQYSIGLNYVSLVPLVGSSMTGFF